MARKNQPSVVQQLDTFHKTTTGFLVFGGLELLVAYAVASWAIDTGELWQYLIAIILLVGGVQNIVKAVLHYGKNR